jgi:hypothetical protein
MNRLHVFLKSKFKWYREWHRRPNITTTNLILLVLVASVFAAVTFFDALGTFNEIAALNTNSASVVTASQRIDDYNTELKVLAKNYSTSSDANEKKVIHKKLDDLVLRRKSVMLNEAKKGSSVFSQNALPADIRDLLPQSTKENIEQDTDIQGVLGEVHFDNFSHPEQSRMEYSVYDKTKGKLFMVRTADLMSLMKIHPGATIKVHGKSIDNNIVPTSSATMTMNSGAMSTGSMTPIAGISVVDPAPLLNQISGNQTELVVLINFTDNTTNKLRILGKTDAVFTLAQINDMFFGTTLTSTAGYFPLNAYYKDNSYNKISFSGVVVDWTTVNFPQAQTFAQCTDVPGTLGPWADDADSKMAAKGINVANYARTIYVTPVIPCGSVGVAWLSTSTTRPYNRAWVMGWVDGAKHEIGHNLGSAHANSFACGTKQIDVNANCTNTEYGDPSDVMGSGHYPLWNAPHKYNAGWLAGNNIQTITTSGQYTLAPLENTTTSLQVLRFIKPNTGDYYYVSYRQPTGTDVILPAGIVTGAQIHIWDGTSNSQTKLLDMTPGVLDPLNPGLGSFPTSSLTDGLTFTDPINQITVKQISHSASRCRSGCDHEHCDYLYPKRSNRHSHPCKPDRSSWHREIIYGKYYE